MDFWEKNLRAEALLFTERSLKYFHPNFMSLSTTHPLFTTCGTSPYEVSKAVTQARFLSGRARVESLTRHWDVNNKEGICPLCKMVQPTLGTIEHLLLSGGCPALVEARLSMLSFIQAYLVPRPHLLPLFQSCWGINDTLTMQFILDCSVIPLIIKKTQESPEPILNELFYVTRTYVFKIFVTRRRLLETNWIYGERQPTVLKNMLCYTSFCSWPTASNYYVYTSLVISLLNHKWLLGRINKVK